VVAELKKGRYVYYHCTEGRGRCDDPYVREEKLVGEMANAVQQFVIAPETIEWLAAAVADSDKTEAGARERAVRQLKGERNGFRRGSTPCTSTGSMAGSRRTLR